MLALFAFPSLPAVLDEADVVDRLEVGLALAEARGLRQTPFLSAVFLNRVHIDSCGQERETTWRDGGTRPAIVFFADDLDVLAARYLPYREALDGFGRATPALETRLWSFLERCRTRGLVVVSTSRAHVQEYE